MPRSLRANLLLLLTALIWGVAFVAQDVAMEFMPPVTFNGIRMALAGFTLMLFIPLLRRPQGVRQERGASLPAQAAMPAAATQPSTAKGTLCLGGFLCGVVLFLGSVCQQQGLLYSTPGKAGFITALYIVLVPLTGLLMGKKVRPLTWLAVAVATLGLFLLCVTAQLTVGAGDLFLILSAFCFTAHILLIDYFAPRTDCLKMSCIQFFITAALCLPVAALFEKPTLQGVWQGILPILYAGVLSGAVGYTLQILGQRDSSPTVASLILCLESVFAVLAGWVLLGDHLAPRELLGCGLMLCGIVLAQWPRRSQYGTRP